MEHRGQRGHRRDDLLSFTYARSPKNPPPRRKDHHHRSVAERPPFRLLSAYRMCYDSSADTEWSGLVCVFVPGLHRCPLCMDDVAVAPRVYECGHIVCAGCAVVLAGKRMFGCIVCGQTGALGTQMARFVADDDEDAADRSFVLLVRWKAGVNRVVLPFAEWRKRFEAGVSCDALPALADVGSEFSRACVGSRVQLLREEADTIEAHLAAIEGDALESEALEAWRQALHLCRERLDEALLRPEFLVLPPEPLAQRLYVDDFHFFYAAASGASVFLGSLNHR